MIELVGDVVVLKTLERHDCIRLWQNHEPSDGIPTEPLNPGLSVEGADQWFDQIQKEQGKSRIHLGIFSKEGELVGDVQLTSICYRHRRADMGVGIARSDKRGKGYGADATRVILRFAFLELDLIRLRARTLSHNVGARRILERVGFVEEGVERSTTYIRGERYDTLVYGLLRDEWVDSSYIRQS